MNNQVRLFSFLLIFLWGNSSFAQNWVLNSFPDLNGLQFRPTHIYSNNGNIFLSSSASRPGGGIYISDNYGQDWAQLSSDVGRLNFAIHPSGTFYAQNIGEFFKSEDNGQTWDAITLPTTSNLAGGVNILIDPVDGAVYLATATEVFKSTDNGGNWQNLGGVNTAISKIRLDKDGNLYLGISFGTRIHRYNEITNSWNDLGRGAPNSGRLSDFIITNNNGVISTSDNGIFVYDESDREFFRVFNTLPADRFETIIQKENSDTLFAGGDLVVSEDIYYSVDEGLNWTPYQSNNLGIDLEVLQFALSENDELLILTRDNLISGASTNSLTDNDNDSFDSTVDCNDNDPTIYPGAPEICGNGIDENCDGIDDTCPDPCNMDFVFNSQAEVNDFDPTCETIQGTCIIWGADITDLSPLAGITTIDGNLTIGSTDGTLSNELLTSLNGLSGLVTITGRLSIVNCAVLTSVEGLSALETIGGVTIQNCPQLQSIFFPSLVSVLGNCNYISLPQVTVIGDPNGGGSGGIQSLGGGITFEDVPALTDINGLANLTSLGGDLFIIGASSLTNVDAFITLIGIDGCVHLINNPLLTDLSGLESLESVGGNIRFIDNSAITNVDNFVGVTEIGGSLFLDGNTNLIDLTGLSDVINIGDTLLIANNPLLATCCSVNDLLRNGGVQGTVIIENNLSGCNDVAEINNNCTDADGDGFVLIEDCDDTNANINPDATEICGNNIDENCDDSICPSCDNNGGDADGDGACADVDCDDNNPNIYPGATEICGNGIDENCDGADEICPLCDNNGGDADGDGFCADVDCDDNNPNIYPGAPETCENGIDENCDGMDDICPMGCNVTIDSDSSKIRIIGLNSAYVSGVVMDANWNLVDQCNFDCSMPYLLNNLASGTYFLNFKGYDADFVEDCAYEGFVEVTDMGGNICDTQGGDADGDGICANEDCDDNNPNLPALPGSRCDDFDATTQWDVIQANGCTCAGTPIPTNCNLSISTDIGSIMIDGFAEPHQFGRVLDSNWDIVDECFDCGMSYFLDNLPGGVYHITFQTFDANWGIVCDVQDFITVNSIVTRQRVLDFHATAAEGVVAYNWTNNTGLENEDFEIQRSVDGVNFETIASRSNAANDNSPKFYQGVDRQPMDGVSSYRVLVNLIDGTQLISTFEKVHIDDIEDFGLFPNPTFGKVNVSLKKFKGKDIEIQLVNQFGVKLNTYQIDNVSDHTFELPLKNIKNGFYTIWVFTDGRRPLGKKLIVSKLY